MRTFFISLTKMRYFYEIKFAICLVTTALANPLTIDLSPNKNNHTIDGSFLGFSTEYFEATQGLIAPDISDTYSLRLIHNIVALTGKPVQIRVGGHSADMIDYNREKLETLFRQLRSGAEHLEKMSRRSNLKMSRQEGPVRYVIDVGFRDPSNIDQITDWITLSDKYLSGNSNNVASNIQKRQESTRQYLEAIEIGNEPEFYRTKERPETYGPDLFAKEYANAVKNVIEKNEWLSDRFPNGAFQCGVVTPYWLPHSEMFLKQFGQYCGSFSLHDYTIGRKTANDTDYNSYDLLTAPVGSFFDDLENRITTAKNLMKGNTYRIGEGNSVNAGGIAGRKYLYFYFNNVFIDYD